MTKRPRDVQRQRVYDWESDQFPRMYQPHSGLDLDGARDFVWRVWVKERGRYGLAKTNAPAVLTKHHGRATGSQNAIRLPRWAMNTTVILHELAHSLTWERRQQGHGATFVGVYIGLLARHGGHDADVLIESATAAGLKIDYRAIGSVPVHSWPDKVAAVATGRRLTLMGIAVELGIGYRTVLGACLQLQRAGRGRWLRNRFVMVQS